MNIPLLKKLKNKFSKKNKVKIVTEGYRITRHWVTLLMVFALLLLVSSFIIFYIYTSYVTVESRKNTEQQPAATTIDRERLQNTIQEFKNKKARFEDVLQDPPSVVDPSI